MIASASLELVGLRSGMQQELSSKLGITLHYLNDKTTQYTATNFKHFIAFFFIPTTPITLFERICLNNSGICEDVTILFNLVHLDGRALSRVESSRIEAFSDGKAHRQKHHG